MSPKTGPTGVPQILKLYPLTTAARGKRLEPFPTMCWMTCPKLKARISALEVDGWIIRLEERLRAESCSTAESKASGCICQAYRRHDGPGKPERQQQQQAGEGDEEAGGEEHDSDRADSDEPQATIADDGLVVIETCALARMVSAHKKYAADRWALLSEEDRDLVTQKGWALHLRTSGVSGARAVGWCNVKCLHAHYAQYLSDQSNVVGEWVHGLLQAQAQRLEEAAELSDSEESA